MGAWDVTAFGNDEAMDWSADLLEADEPAAFVEDTLAPAKRGGYIDAPDGSLLVAAAAVVSAACGGVPKGLPDDVRDWLQGKEPELKALAPVALLAIQRVRSEQSELREQWQEGDDFQAWSRDLDAIAKALRRPA